MVLPDDEPMDDFEPDDCEPGDCGSCRESQEEFDRLFFQEIIRRGCDNPDVLRRQAELLSCSGDYATALDLDRTLAARYPEDRVVHYNLACSLSMTGHHGEALKALERAIELGYVDFAHIEADSDLDPVRDLPGFQELLRRGDSGDAQIA